MKLYYAPGACSLSPHIVAREAGIDLKLDKVDLFGTRKTESGRDFNTVNPKGYVPALELDDGQVLTEGPVIVQYLADRKPATDRCSTRRFRPNGVRSSSTLYASASRSSTKCSPARSICSASASRSPTPIFS
jgi:glutathione S-transferase